MPRGRHHVFFAVHGRGWLPESRGQEALPLSAASESYVLSVSAVVCVCSALLVPRRILRAHMTGWWCACTDLTALLISEGDDGTGAGGAAGGPRGRRSRDLSESGSESESMSGGEEEVCVRACV